LAKVVARLSKPTFFFSSRRRHTRFSRDWSSDVCSSDLSAAPLGTTLVSPVTIVTPANSAASCISATISRRVDIARPSSMTKPARSEERRVGKDDVYAEPRELGKRKLQAGLGEHIRADVV